MKLFPRISLVLTLAFLFTLATTVSAQITYPRPSQAQTITQTVGDAKITIVYHRPNVNGRTIFGAADDKPLVPYGQIWRAGANENTTFEITQDATIEGKKLPKGKYGFHVIPGADNWTLIFNKVNNVWGTVTPKEENDALRVDVKAEEGPMHESFSFLINNVKENSAEVSIAWDKVRVPFTVDVGDVGGRILNQVRSSTASIPLQAANFVLGSKREANYEEAIGWVDAVQASTKVGQPGYRRITYNAGFVKSRILAAMGKTDEAVELAQKTIDFARAENKKLTDAGKRALFNPRGIGFLESQMKSWKSAE